MTAPKFSPDGYYVVNLFLHGTFFAKRTLKCGSKTFENALLQWKRNGFKVMVESQPNSDKRVY